MLSEITTAPRGVHTGLASYFRALCFEASRRQYGIGYSHVGRTLAGSLASEIPHDIDDTQQWDDIIDELRDCIARDDIEGARNWFKGHFPRFMKLVPARRRQQFLRGVFAEYEETGLAIWAEKVGGGGFETAGLRRLPLAHSGSTSAASLLFGVAAQASYNVILMHLDASPWFRHLKALGLSQGFLTHAQVNEALPLDVVDPEEIGRIVERLRSFGIAITPDVT